MINVVLVIFALLCIVLFVYAIHSFILIYYYFKFHKKKPKRATKELTSFPKVTIQLPIYNEKYVVRRLLASVVAIDYPKEKLEIQVLDDSNDETSRIVADLVQQYRKDNYEIKHIRRGSRLGFKAGALQYGLARAKGDYLAIFDADFVVPRDFLKALLPEFEDSKTGGVQARWGHLNDDESLLTRAQAAGLDNHFALEQRLRAQAGCFINFNGTCGIWYKPAIVAAGGWHRDTLAEDVDLSYRVQLGGWKIKYRDDFVVYGELPNNADNYRIQQNRWAKGTVQVAVKLLPKVLRKPLSPIIKYEAFVHLTCHLCFLAMLGLAIFSLPVVYYKVAGLVPAGFYIFPIFLTIGAISYPVLYFLSQKLSYRNYPRTLLDVMGLTAYTMGLSVSNTKAIIEGLFGKNNLFIRTPKSGGTRNKYRPETKAVVPVIEIILGIYMFISLLYVLANMQLAFVPFLLLYVFGFLSLGISSIRNWFTGFSPQEALCSRKNS